MNDNHKSKLIEVCTKEFFTHPNWGSVIELLNFYLEDLDGIDNVDTNKTNDEIATEVKAKQITKERLQNFIDDTLTLQKIKGDVPTTTRKYK